MMLHQVNFGKPIKKQIAVVEETGHQRINQAHQGRKGNVAFNPMDITNAEVDRPANNTTLLHQNSHKTAIITYPWSENQCTDFLQSKTPSLTTELRDVIWGKGAFSSLIF